MKGKMFFIGQNQFLYEALNLFFCCKVGDFNIGGVYIDPLLSS